MRQYIKTSWYYHFFEEDCTTKKSNSNYWNDGIWETNRWQVKRESLKQGLEDLAKYCNKNGFEIKGIIPIDRAQSYEYGQNAKETSSWAQGGWGYAWGLGKGWGITMTDGFAAMLQSIEMLSDEEYEKRVAEDQRLEDQKAEKERLESERHNLSSLISHDKDKIVENNKLIVSSEGIISSGIVKNSRGVLGSKTVYIVNGQEYSSRDAANAYLEQVESRIVKLKAENRGLENHISECLEGMKRFEEKLAAFE